MLPPKMKKTLADARPFRYLDIHELEELVSYSRIIHYVKGEYILSQGKHADGMYILMKGNAVISALVLGKEDLELATLSVGDFIGEVNLIIKGVSSISVIANDEVDCLLVSTEYFEMLSLFFPHIKYKIARAVTEDVCNRHFIHYQRVIDLIAKTNMLTQSFLAEVVRTFTTPQIVSYESVHLDIQHLKTSDFFNAFTDEEFNEILKQSILLNAPKDSLLIKENEEDLSYYVILRGAVQLSIGKNNKIAKCAVLGPMEFFGNMALIINKSSHINYLTCERAVLLKISEISLSYLEKNQICLWYKLYDFICKSFVSLEDAERKLIIRLNSELYNR